MIELRDASRPPCTCGSDVIVVREHEVHAAGVYCQRCNKNFKWIGAAKWERLNEPDVQAALAARHPMHLPIRHHDHIQIGDLKVSFEAKENGGSLFKNERKTGNQPDYRGDCNINGVACKISGWVKQKKDGSKFLSLAFTKKEEEAGL